MAVRRGTKLWGLPPGQWQRHAKLSASAVGADMRATGADQQMGTHSGSTCEGRSDVGARER